MGRIYFILIALCLTLPLYAQTDVDISEAESRGFDGLSQSENFAVFSRSSEVSEIEAEEFLEFAEEIYLRLRTRIGEDHTPDRRIVIILAGMGITDSGRVRFPSVDELGRVILVRFSSQVQGYKDEATHEIVHAFRRATGPWFSSFWEEGIAELITMQVHPEEIGFPRYGFPIIVASGQLIANDKYVPIQLFKDNPQQLGSECLLQAYLERASFFDFLAKRIGIEKFLELMYKSTEPSDSDIELFFESTFSDLVNDWENELRNAYLIYPAGAELTAQYLAHPAIESQSLCVEEIDF